MLSGDGFDQPVTAGGRRLDPEKNFPLFADLPFPAVDRDRSWEDRNAGRKAPVDEFSTEFPRLDLGGNGRDDDPELRSFGGESFGGSDVVLRRKR